ncbi:hypothetical protein BUALT_Bualt05G0075700 [Buddleja alternifolia]|uniref:MSP domain-containing protein n=1 Tax=Buddleja alternifolia TaxID=168488 RepID=A0AAV6XJB2_9LAMI|nr:hypothetical protein BUALT_Bualt05G0075700 [Buddleja alternifolia]
MSREALLNFEPQELSFPFELNKQLSSSIQLWNNTQNPVAFKLLSTNPKKYGVRPRIGVLLPGSACEITVTMVAMREAPHNMRCKDKFMIQSAVASPGSTTEDARKMFNKEAGHIFQESKLRVVYCKPTESSAIENSNSNNSEVTELIVEPHDNVLPMSMIKLLDIQPPQLQYPVKMNKDFSCSIRLSNVNENHVAFRVKTASPKYFVQPNKGIVLPHSTCEITVRRQAQMEEDPSDMKSEDKLAIQSVVATAAATMEDIIPDMFNKAGSPTEECELKVVHISKREENRNQLGEFILKGIISCLLGLVSWYLMKETLSLIWYSTLECDNVSNDADDKNDKEIGIGVCRRLDSEDSSVKTTDPKKYCVQPNFGIVLPRSTCDVIVRMQPQTKIPLDRQCKDKFLIQSTIAPTSRKFTSEMFETGGVVEEFKLRVVYTFPPHPQSSDYQISEAYSSQDASTLSERNSNVTEVIQGLDRNESHVGDLFKKGITIGLLGLIFWYLLRKMLPLIWSVTFVIMMLVVKMIKSIVSDSVEDWIVKSLVFVCSHFLSKLFGGRWNLTTS